MSLWERTLGAVRKMILVEDRIDRLEKSIERLQGEVQGQERRLAQLEFIVLGPIPPDCLRLPR